MIASGAATLAFYPDRLLVFRGATVGAVAYSALQAVAKESRFVEERGVPSDAQVVGKTWKYVNKNGGPDRRFNNNSEIPICLYSDLELSSAAGLSARFMASKPQSFDIVSKAFDLLRVLERHTRDEASHRPA
jgi:hypothetical protein